MTKAAIRDWVRRDESVANRTSAEVHTLAANIILSHPAREITDP